MKARKVFAQKVKEAGGPANVAYALGRSRGAVDNILRGSDPGLSTAYAIEQLYGIKMQDWCEPMKVETTRRLVGNG